MVDADMTTSDLSTWPSPIGKSDNSPHIAGLTDQNDEKIKAKDYFQSVKVKRTKIKVGLNCEQIEFIVPCNISETLPWL